MIRILMCLVLVLPTIATAEEKTPHQVYKEHLDKKHKGESVEKKPSEKSPHQVYKEYLDTRKDKPPAHEEHKPKEHKGKACGNGFISAGKECHIGQTAPEKPPIKAASEKPKISPAIIAVPVAAAATYALSQPPELEQPEKKLMIFEYPRMAAAFVSEYLLINMWEVRAVSKPEIRPITKVAERENLPFTPFISALGLLLFWGHARKVKKTTF